MAAGVVSTNVIALVIVIFLFAIVSSSFIFWFTPPFSQYLLPSILVRNAGEAKELARMKLMLLGSAGSGKTSLIKMLIHEQKPKRPAPTETMEVEEWRIKYVHKSISFGGLKGLACQRADPKWPAPTQPWRSSSA